VPSSFSAQPASPPPILSLAKRSPLLHDRPYVVEVPFRYDPDLAAPLIVEIHGFGDEPFDVERFLGLTPVASEHGALLVTVTGSHDSHERRFWNATDACCDVDHRAPDDVAYLDAVLDEVSQRFKVDTNRVYVVGHSNGGFMAHRYACERSERIAGFVSIAGAGWLDPERCQPAVPVAALQISGDADPIVHARGGSVGEPATLKVLRDTGLPLPANLRLGRYPDVHTSLAPWIEVDGCAATTEPGKPLDLDYKIHGEETTVERCTGCRAGVELWTVHHAGHTPSFGHAWFEAVYEFLESHPKFNGY
jgi:polyhydroxybutyrate depolymerase